MQVDLVGLNDVARWDAYVGPRASSVTDLAQWRNVLHDVYGTPSHFLLANHDGRDVGALALYEIKHALFGHYLTTAAYGNDGGLFFESDAARDALIAEAKAVAQHLGVAYLDIRTRNLPLAGFEADRHYRASVVPLTGNAEAALNHLPATTRNQVRRGQKEGFTVSVGAEQVDAFHNVFHEHMRDLGSPAHGIAFYRAIQRHLGDRADFYVVRDGSTLVSGALVFRVNSTAQNHHTVSLRRFNRRCPNYLLYWRMIADSYARGLKTFDMGRSEADSSQLKFKENWGTRETEMTYNYHLVRAREVPKVSPHNPKYRAAIAVWSNLPLFVTKAVGPKLISGLA